MLQLGVSLLAVGAIFQLFDGIQGVATGARLCRARNHPPAPASTNATTNKPKPDACNNPRPTFKLLF